jgi:hypothetical protein
MRLLERTDLGSVRVLVADSRSARVPDSVQVPHPHGTAYVMPRFSEVRGACTGDVGCWRREHSVASRASCRRLLELLGR